MLCKFMNLRQKEYSEEQKQNAPPANKEYKNGYFWERNKTYLKNDAILFISSYALRGITAFHRDIIGLFRSKGSKVMAGAPERKYLKILRTRQILS